MATNKLYFTKQQQCDYICTGFFNESVKITSFQVLYKGFDCLNQRLFCVCTVDYVDKNNNVQDKTSILWFNDFSTYFAFLKGEIYENATYFQYELPAAYIDPYHIDENRLNFESLCSSSLQDDLDATSETNILNCVVQEKQRRLEWLSKLKQCKTERSILIILNKISASEFCNELDWFIRQLYFEDIFDVSFAKFLIKNFYRASRSTILMYILQHGIDCLTELYDDKKLRYKTKKFILDIQDRTVLKNEIGFNPNTCFYYIRTYAIDVNNYIPFEFTRDIANFEELKILCNCNLSNADFSSCFEPLDFTGCNILGICLPQKQDVHIKKYFDGSFFVVDIFDKQHKNLLKQRKFIFIHDWLKYLKYDISNADLLLCSNIANMKPENMIISNVKVCSDCEMAWGIKLTEYIINSVPILEYANTKALVVKNDIHVDDKLAPHIYYISDLHLVHKIQQSNCKTWNDIIVCLQKIVQRLNSSIDLFDRMFPGTNVVFNGDTSSDFEIFRAFCVLLKKYMRDKNIFFTLGNHEFWSGHSIDEYKKLINECGMYLLCDNMFAINGSVVDEISYESIFSDNLPQIVNQYSFIFIGGTGFAGQNQMFNASHGIYNFYIERDSEIKLSMKFQLLYDHVAKTLRHKNVVVATHMPMEDWHKTPYYVPGFVYLHGHTHNNRCIDNDAIRIFADNQVGYANKSMFLKCFGQSVKYDIFYFYKDGIYEITSSDYREFYRGKHISMDFYRPVYKLYMLKKNGIYCFIHMSESGKLQILNGGSMKALKHKDIMYYFNNMDKVIDKIQKPMNDYTKLQKQVASFVRSFGGYGYIHGCIVHIDFYNHLYVNPNDGTVVPYFAYDIIDKHVYNSLPNLLKAQAPQLYESYQKLLESPKGNTLIQYEPDMPIDATPYYSTDIYSASRIIKKMQKLEDDILSIWIDVDDESTMNNNNLLTESYELKDD